MSKWTESYFPLIFAILGGAVWFYFEPRFPLDEKEFLAATISLGAVLTGFIATSKAILAALPSDSAMKRLRESGYIDDLLSYLSQALYSSLTFCVLSLLGFFLLEKVGPSLPRWYSTGWVMFGVFSIFAFVRIARLLVQIIKYEPK